MVNTKGPLATSVFRHVPATPPDPIFELTMQYIKDDNTNKVNLGAGAYRDDNAQPWVLSAVLAAKIKIANDPYDNHEYPPIAGRPKFRALAAKCIFGAESPAILEGRVASNQTISGTGANHLAGLFLRTFHPQANLYLSSPTWTNHHALYESVGFLHAKDYPYWDAENKVLDIEGMLSCMRSAPEGSIFLLHACAHNPTGVDPSPEQWSLIADAMQEKKHIPLFDSAYQGFASGNLDKDAYSVRLFVERGFELFVCQSFSKNLGIYAERTGALHIVTRDSVSASCVSTQLADLTRSEISCTPAYGAKIAEEVLSDDVLYAQWRDQDLPLMAGRIIEMRQALHKLLTQLQTPGNWDHIITQIGMFSYTGLTPAQCQTLIEEHSIYLASNGRISISGLNTHNIAYFAQAMDKVVRTVQ
ncbi:putative Aspartate transaminase [Taphrina deformans PYCC 5710]|uniref:aspartate transaminase n=1 Tax=Taphrina deformans (strain PYCC 5710 / ATCC 11124 / CBS 356.35 / IMI 108563 / JCM 9778 / NBRC 8474) TaxID=1097556 RepID=R4X795_TAPDE|nr:putative Aspartate transaminase [Taphrina deformans PYCC 5710]|eukprot:CCG81192.1 putative Aspartate transaminase [Taphrina deformans PYCC 5710]